MAWIEDWLQVSPDGGDGSLELLLMLIAAAGVTMALVAWSSRARSVLRRMLAPTPIDALRRVSLVQRESDRSSAT